VDVDKGVKRVVGEKEVRRRSPCAISKKGENGSTVGKKGVGAKGADVDTRPKRMTRPGAEKIVEGGA